MQKSFSETKTSLLVVEDSEYDFETLLRVFKQLSFSASIYHCLDDDEALDFLFHKGQYEAEKINPIPSLILLDLNLPGTDGRDVLDRIKTDEKLKIIPVIVFTTSSSPQDIKTCYQKGANTYIVKPMDFNKLKITIETILIHWFEVSILPKSIELSIL